MKNTSISTTSSEVVITTTTVIDMSTSAVKRLRQYFENHPDEVIDIDTLASVANIRDWTRAIRFVRSDYKMTIKYVRETSTHKAGYIYTKRIVAKVA